MGLYERKKTLSDIFTTTKKGSIQEVKLSLPNRPLTSGEVKLVQSVYKNSIDCSKIKIYLGSYFPFDAQDVDTLVTPNGNVYVMQKLYKSDYSTETDDFKKIFLHEMGHVWQHQKKLKVLIHAGAVQACARLKSTNPNDYNIFETKKYPSKIMPNLVETLPKKFVDYNLEQQAEMVSDYWAIQHGGIGLLSRNNKANIKNHNLTQVIELYKTKIEEALS
ncbi:Uncharacterised protein [Acinetobacter baumannii]|uniref:hypothetical protein n=1 Tax=Acinetobacter baumannii TaxID=470 RepID=UPI0009D3128E|nr:hypothetical protein [Acinetobacter baumannii]SLM58136.1 Uncharacterised protein [Acinetobacter baumannii]